MTGKNMSNIPVTAQYIMNEMAAAKRSWTVLCVVCFVAGIAIGLGMAVYLALTVLQTDMIMPGPSGIWWA